MTLARPVFLAQSSVSAQVGICRVSYALIYRLQVVSVLRKIEEKLARQTLTAVKNAGVPAFEPGASETSLIQFQRCELRWKCLKPSQNQELRIARIVGLKNNA